MAMTEKQPDKTPKRGLKYVWDRLTRPAAGITEVGERRQVQLIAGLTLIIAFITSIGAGASLAREEATGEAVLIFLAATFFIAYGFSRSRRFQIAAYLIVGSLSLIAFLRTGTAGVDIAFNFYIFLPLAFLFSSVLLSKRASAFFVTVNSVALLFLPRWIPEFTYLDISISFGPLIALGALFLVAQNYRDAVERDRLIALTTTNKTLQKLRNELDERVQMRTKELSETTAALQASQERFSLAVEGSNDGIWDWNIATNKTFFSARWKEMIGYADHEIANEFTEYEKRLHPDDHDWVMQTLNDYLEGKIATYELELRLQHKDNSYRRVLVQGIAQRDESGSPIRMVGSHTDITERSHIEEAVRERETLLRTIIDSTPDWIFVKDLEHRYLMVNQGYADSFHMTPDDFVGKNDLEIGFPEDIVKGNPEKGIRGFWADDREIMERGELKIIDVEPAVVDGEERWLNTIKAPLKDTVGHVSGIVGFVHDITDLIRIEEAVRERETLLRTIIDSTPDWIFVKDVNHQYLMVNQGYANSFHITPEDFIGKNDLEIGFPEEIVKGNPAKGIRGFWADDREIMERGELKVIDAEPAVVDGEQRWLNTIKAPLKNAAGQVTGIVGFVHDITELQNIQTILSQRATELQTVADVGTVAATILQPDELLQNVVDLTKERFNLYHAHIYLLNENKTELTLTNGAGEVGRTMVAKGRQIELAQEQSLVARAARIREGVIINDVQAEPGFLPHPLLPDTRAEMAVPFIAGQQVLGVLDVQADSINRFTAEDVSIFTTLASQVAVALQNARRYDEAQRALDDLTRLQRIMAREGWNAFLLGQERPFSGFAFDGKGAKPVTGHDDLVTTVAETDEAATDTTTAVTVSDMTLSIPITVRGEQIGQLGLRNPNGGPIPERSQFLLNTITQQMSEALDRARLSEQTQAALAGTEALYQGGNRIVRAETIESVLAALVDSTFLKHFVQHNILLFEQFQANQQPAFARVAATQRSDGQPPQMPAGTFFALEQFPTTKLFSRDEPVLFSDINNDQRVDGNSKDVMTSLKTRGLALFPLVASGQWIGVVMAQSDGPISWDDEQVRQTASLVDQGAAVIQSMLLLQDTQERAEEEQVLRQITTRVSTAVDAESVLRTAAEEIGRALGLEGSITLGGIKTDKATNGANKR